MWHDRGSYYIHSKPQSSPEWFNERKCRLTSTRFSSIAHPTTYRGPSEVIKIYKGTAHPMTPGDLVLSKIGMNNEPKGRDWYELNFSVKVNEVGLAVPKWDNRIGASSDGEVEGTRGIIEIKSPLNLYSSLKIEESRIMASHYDQMQGTMAIMNKEWCDYVVYPHLDDEVYVERVYFDSLYWEELYRELTLFLDTNKDLFVERLPYKLN